MAAPTSYRPRPHRSRSALWPSPLGELHESVRAVLENRIQRGLAAYAEEFKGVTSDGTVRTGLFDVEEIGHSTQPLREAAQHFLASLSAKKRANATFDIDSIEWRAWSNAHPFLFRHGICLHHLTEPQREAALTLMRAGMSERGFEAARNVMRLSEHLRELTDRPEEHGEWHYFISIFGAPSAELPWGWQIDGHHLNVNCLVLGDRVVMTPHLVGGEPLLARSGIYAGACVLREEEAVGHAFMTSLSPQQRSKATLGDRLPRELLTTAPWDNFVMKYEGIRFDELTPAQRERLGDVIGLYVGRLPAGHAEAKRREVEKYYRETYFGWIGPVDDESPFYYRVYSPVILIEFVHQHGVAFDNDEPTRNHAHAIVRTPNGNDYGKALLHSYRRRLAARDQLVRPNKAVAGSAAAQDEQQRINQVRGR